MTSNRNKGEFLWERKSNVTFPGNLFSDLMTQYLFTNGVFLTENLVNEIDRPTQGGTSSEIVWIIFLHLLNCCLPMWSNPVEASKKSEFQGIFGSFKDRSHCSSFPNCLKIHLEPLDRWPWSKCFKFELSRNSHHFFAYCELTMPKILAKVPDFHTTAVLHSQSPWLLWCSCVPAHWACGIWLNFRMIWEKLSSQHP